MVPRAILSDLMAELVAQLPGIRDGDAKSVHAARVATRRLREVVPLLGGAHPDQVAPFLTLVRRAGRRLGRVRELDVMHEHLEQIEQRAPEAAAAAAVARRSIAERQGRARRRLIKALERMRLDEIDARTVLPMRGLEALRNRTRTFGDWSDPLRDRIGDEARAVAAAVEHASGVYFPNRAHQARIAVKKLRYSVELAERTGLWHPPRLLRDLRRVQGCLGELHDAQVLLDQIEELVPGDAVAAPDRALLKGALRSAISAHHAEYVAKRDRLRAIAEACERFAASRPVLMALVRRRTG